MIRASLFFLSLVFSLQAQPIGTPAKDVLSRKDLQTIKRQFANAAPASVEQSQANTTAIRRDTAVTSAQLAAVSSQLAALTLQMAAMQVQLANKDMSRVSVLEIQFKAFVDQKQAIEARNLVEHDSYVNWFRGIAGGLAMMLIGAGFAYFRDKHIRLKVETVGDRVDMVGDSMDLMTGNMKTLTRQTNGMTDTIKELAFKAGVKVGHEEQKQRGPG